MKYKLPHFGEVDLAELKEYYQVDIDYNNQAISVDLNLKEQMIEANRLDYIKSFLENIENQDIINRAFIDFDFKEGNEHIVMGYLEFHVHELKEELVGMINFEDSPNDPKKQLMEQLKLVRIGFYPDGKYGAEAFAVFDYTVDRKITDELLVVNLNKEGDLMYLAWES